MKNHSLSALFSFILSTALVFLPVMPVTAGPLASTVVWAKEQTDPASKRRAAPSALSVAPLAPALTVTKVDSFPDPDGDGKAEPGDTITYAITITNNGTTDAANVVFNDTIDPNTTLVPGSVQTQPIASDDTYNVLGNVRIQPGAAQGLLANDCDPDNGSPCSNAGLTASGPTVSAQGGNVSVNPNGSFSYNPPPGFEGTDSFTYTIIDSAGQTDTATATFTVNDVVWFVDNTAAGAGDGRLTSPFNSLASLVGASDPDEPSDVIFIHQGTGSYGGGIVLEDGQRLVGQGTGLDAALSSFGITVPPHSDPRPAATGNPTLTNAGGNVITLANGNTVSHLNAAAAASAGSAIFGSDTSGTTSINNVSVSAGGPANGVSFINSAAPLSMTNSTVSCNSSGTAVLVNGGSANLTFTNTSVSQNGGRVIYIHNRTGGVVNFDGLSTVTGINGSDDAVTLIGNASGAIVNIAAALQLNTSATGARGLVATGGGFTLNLTGGSNAVSSTGGAAVDVENINANITFSTTFSTDSNGSGVRVHNVSGVASFGNTAISNSAGVGVQLTNNAANINFSDLDVAPASGRRALHATSNTGRISSESGVISATGAAAVEIVGPSAINRTPLNVQLTSVSAGGGANGIILENTSAAGSPGGFRVLGAATGTDRCGGHINTATNPDTIIAPVASECSGGRITGTTGGNDPSPFDAAGIGVRLVNADSVSLARMRLDNHSNFALYGNNVNGFTLSNSLIDGANGDDAAFDENAVTFDNLLGSASITSCSISGGHEDNLDVENTHGALDLVVSHSDFGATSLNFGDDALAFSGTGNSVMKLTVNSSRFRFGRSDMLQVTAHNSAVMEVVVLNSIFDNDHPNTVSGGGGIILQALSPTASLALNFNLAGNVFRDALGHAINIFKGTGIGSMSGTINANAIGVPGVAGSGSGQARGINVDGDGAGTVTVAITNNQIHNYNDDGININVGSPGASSVAMNATVTGNIVAQPGQFGSNAFELNGGTNSGNINQICLDLRNNTFEAGGSDANFEDDVNLRQRFGTTVRMPGYTGAQFDTLAVRGYIEGRNPGDETVTVSSSGAGGGYQNTSPGGSACAAAAAPVASAAASFDLSNEAGPDVQLAAAPNFASGFPAEDLFADNLFSLSLKARRGLSYSEGGRLLGADFAGVEARSEAAPATVAPVAFASNETVNVQIGALRAGDSVTITFKVIVASPFDGAQPQVSNQGTVTADGGISVLTDDPDAPGAADPTVTLLLLPPTISINDASVAEPATGTANALFTVTLSHPYTHQVTVNFATANGGANPAMAGDDYTPTSGTVTFAPGQSIQTIAVPVLADAIAGEGDETFLVNLSGAFGGSIGDGQAVGTIRDPSVPSPVIISELRTSGPAGSEDDFVELYNATDEPITVVSSDGSEGWSIVKSGSDCSATPVIVGVIPNGTVIPARGNYLLTGSAYSLGAYAAGDANLIEEIEDDRNLGLFTTGELSNISSATALDAVGFGANTGNNCDLLREGDNLPGAAGSTSEHSFVRKVTKGLTHDTGDNSADFVVVSTTPSAPVGDNTPVLGAPGPEATGSARGPVPCAASSGTALFNRTLIDPSVSASSAPNVVRDTTPDAPNNSTLGTIDFRRTFTNNTGAGVTSLRFRVVDLSTFPVPAGTADLRARNSGNITVGSKLVRGATLETPPAQPNGGGVNSSLAAGSITLATPLPNGTSVNLRFLFGVEQVGDYDIAIVLEASPGPSGKDFWMLSGHTEDGGHTDRGCNRPPVADAGADQTVECSGGEAFVTLDGSASSDPDGDEPLSFEWSNGATTLGTGQTLGVNLPLGSHTITLTVTDPSGDSSQDMVVVNVVDTTKPIVTPPAAVTVTTGPDASSCGALVGDEALGTATAEDGCQGSLTVTRTGVPAGNFFPVGTTVVTYSATDAAGNTGTATQTVTVIDDTPPTVTPPADVTVANEPDSCSANVNPGTASADDNCPGVSVAGTRDDDQPLSAPYPVGTTTITWTATDTAGNTGTATQTVTVQDTQLPSVLSSVAVMTMGPPFNFALINVGLSAAASDNCPGLSPLQVSVFSDEDDGFGIHSPDAVDIGLGTLKLRRERNGDGNGRVYLIVVKATDAWGNTAASCRTVTVPLSSSASHINSVNAQAAAAAAFCSANDGAAPSGFFPVGP